MIKINFKILYTTPVPVSGRVPAIILLAAKLPKKFHFIDASSLYVIEGAHLFTLAIKKNVSLIPLLYSAFVFPCLSL